MPPLYQYADPVALVTITKAKDPGALALLTRYVTDAGDAINRYCHRYFVLTGPLTRTFDAPASTCLDLVDLQPTPTPTVTQGGVPLVLSMDYVFDPHYTDDLNPTYTAAVRLQAGFRRRWGYQPVKRVSIVSVPLSRGGLYDEILGATSPYLAAPSPSESTITITGVWGYSAVAPPAVAFACEILATRMWVSATRSHIVTAGAAGQGQNPLSELPFLIDADLQALLAPFVYVPTSQAGTA